MKTSMLGLLAETSIHPGSGRGMGVVDLPVAREAATSYPVIVGSSLKGALRDSTRGSDIHEKADSLFGKEDSAGDLLVSDARLLLLPVRSLTGSYRWVTCPHIIERYRRDLSRAGLNPSPETTAEITALAKGKALTDGSGELFLEERQFSILGKTPKSIVDAIEPLIRHEDTQKRLNSQIAIIHDDDFAWFARYALSVQARNQLDDGTKQSKNLWYEETLPPDTVMYALVSGREDDTLGNLGKLFPETNPYLQVGGNETVGQGWFAVVVRNSTNEVEE